MSVSPPLRTPAETARQLNTTPGALAQKRYTGDGPKFVKLGGRSVRYRQEDIDAWVESCLRTRTDDPGTPGIAQGTAPAKEATQRGRSTRRRAASAPARSGGSAA